MGRASVQIRAPLHEQLEVISEAEGMPVQELVDHILRSFSEEYDFEEDEDDEESDEDPSDEDIESEGQDAKT